MNCDEARQILLLYRPGTADAEDPQIAEALALARQDPELARWLEEHCTRQESVRAKFRHIEPPAGLKEQIVSEHAAHLRRQTQRRSLVLAAAAAVMLLAAGLAVFWPGASPESDLAKFRIRMVGIALRGYSMDLETTDMAQIRAYLAQQKAPADYALPGGFQKVAVIGCAVEKWQGANVAMVCFRTGRPLPPGEPGDLWLFVMDEKSLKNAPASGPPEFHQVSRLATAIWKQGGRVYLLGTTGDELAVRSYL